MQRVIRTTVVAGLVLAAVAATCSPSPAAGDPCAAAVAAKNAALVTYQADLDIVKSIRRQIPLAMRDLLFWDGIERRDTVRAEAAQQRATALQPRIDASAVGSARRAHLEQRQQRYIELSEALLDEASHAGANADGDEFYLRELRDDVSFAQETADEDHALLDQAQAALAACRAAHLTG
jgi:hypothetical protein